MDITQLFDEDWFDEAANLDDEKKVERIQILNEFISSQKISNDGDFYAISEFIMTESFSETPLIVKGIIKLTILLRNQLDLTMFLSQMLKLTTNPLYKADVKPFLAHFTTENLPYNEAIHEIMKSILNSAMNDSVKI